MTATETGEHAIAGPERPGGQGLDPSQEESGNQAIYLLLSDPVVGPQTDFVATYRNDAYEVWAQRGMVRFQRHYGAAGGYEYEVIEIQDRNPIENQDSLALATVEEELAAARRSGNPTDDPGHAYVEPEQVSYPLAYERIAQLFDSPSAPDLVVNPKCYAFGRQPGQHGTLDIVQSRAPLIFSGPGVRPGVCDAPARHVDIAPTIARLMGFPHIDGKDACGRPSSDVYLKRQDGRPLEEILDLDAEEELRSRPERVYLFLMDGLSHTELRRRLEHETESIPHLRRLIERGHAFRHGSITNFPSITWPAHNTIGTGCWGGHHDIVNNTYYLRETREVANPYGQQFETAAFLGDGVETLYEAFHRVYGAWEGSQGAFTSAIHEPCTRGPDHSVLEGRVIGDRDRLKALTRETEADISPRWLADGRQPIQNESIVDSRGTAQTVLLFSEDSHPPPIFTYHNFLLPDGVGHDYGPHHDGLRIALDETDRRIGRVLRTLEERGYFDTTLFIIAADHGMAPTRAELAANQGELLPKKGMKAVVPAPFVYLLDMAVKIEPAREGGSATITVLANDAGASGERPPVADAEVDVSGPNGQVLAKARTDSRGVASVAIPQDIANHDLAVTVQHETYNERHLRLDGSNAALDLRELLYGASRGRGK